MPKQKKVAPLYAVDFPIVHSFGEYPQDGVGNSAVIDPGVMYIYEEEEYDCEKIGETTLFSIIDYSLNVTMGNESFGEAGVISADHVPSMTALRDVLLSAAKMITDKLPGKVKVSGTT